MGKKDQHEGMTDIERKYEELRALIDGGSESMTHADAMDVLRFWRTQHEGRSGDAAAGVRIYTADQMHTYARAAVERERARTTALLDQYAKTNESQSQRVMALAEEVERLTLERDAAMALLRQARNRLSFAHSMFAAMCDSEADYSRDRLRARDKMLEGMREIDSLLAARLEQSVEEFPGWHII